MLFQAVLQENHLEEGIPYAQEKILGIHCPGSHFGSTLRQNMLEALYLYIFHSVTWLFGECNAEGLSCEVVPVTQEGHQDIRTSAAPEDS